MFGLIGLAMKAGKIVIGDGVILKAIQLSQVYLLLVATDASNRTKRTVSSRARANNIPLIELANKSLLGSRMGKRQIAVAAVIDRSLAQAIQNKWADVKN